MTIVQEYLEGLKKAYYTHEAGDQWEYFEKISHGASEESIAKLRALYPDIPDSLLQLLDIADGTYGREYNGKRLSFYLFGSDVDEYPYYLLSTEQMINKEGFQRLDDYINRKFGDDIEIDEKIIDNATNMHWLHFSDCMNKGETSRLFIDFSPSAKGRKGQIVRVLHDPDQINVIADSFDEYLRMLIDERYGFITEDVVG